MPLFIPRPLVRTNQWVIVLSVIASWISHQNWILFIPLIAGLLGICVGFNPVMWIAKVFLRKAATAYIPEDRAQQKFNQYIAVGCLILSCIGFYSNWVILGYFFSAMVALAALIAILGFCVGCVIRFQWSQYRYRRNLNSQT